MNITIDPLTHYPDHEKKDILAVCGIVPAFILEGDARLGMRENATQAYGFPLFEFDHDKVTVSDTGIWADTAPLEEDMQRDPDLYPLVKIEHENGDIFYQYLYGLVAFIEKDTQFFTRMD